MSEIEDARYSGIARLVSGAGDVLGTAIGAIVGVSTGDPVLVISGAVAGSVFGKSIGEVATRALSARQEHRAGQLVVQAFAVLKAKEVMGEHVRADGFFDGDRSDGDEFVEGVIQSAMGAYEERKIVYLANLLANVCFHPEIDTASANYALAMAEQLSWTELRMLGIFWAAQQNDRFAMPDYPKSDHIGSWEEATVHQTYLDLTDRHRLIHHVMKEPLEGRLPMYDLNLSGIRLTNAGALVAGLAELEAIPRSDLEAMYEFLIRPPEAPSGNVPKEKPASS